MNCISSRCLPGCEVTCPEPCAYSRGLGPCVASCGDSTALICPPPVHITFRGAIVTTCPQESIVASCLPQPHSYSSGMGSSCGGLSKMGGSYASGGSYGCGSSSGGMSGKGGSSGCGGSSSGGCYLRKFYTSSSRGSRLGN